MAATGTLIPARVNMTAMIGADFQATVTLYSDAAQTLPFDLTGYTAEVSIGGGLLVLTVGAGLTIAAAVNGTIVMALTHTQTAALPGPAQHYALKLTDGSGTVSFPLDGRLYLKTP